MLRRNSNLVIDKTKEGISTLALTAIPPILLLSHYSHSISIKFLLPYSDFHFFINQRKR